MKCFTNYRKNGELVLETLLRNLKHSLAEINFAWTVFADHLFKSYIYIFLLQKRSFLVYREIENQDQAR